MVKGCDQDQRENDERLGLGNQGQFGEANKSRMDADQVSWHVRVRTEWTASS